MKEKRSSGDKSTISLLGKGFLIGSSMSVPGVSGGTMAILLGIYDRMIHAVSHFFEDVRGNMLFLGRLALGGVAGICTLSLLLEWLIERIPLMVGFFFIGVVAGGIPVLYREMGGCSFGKLAGVAAGLAAVIGITFLPEGMLGVRMGISLEMLLFWLVTGIVVALALVLPGISTSHMLLVLGLYQATLHAISHFEVLFLACLGISVLVGVFLVTRPIEWMMNRWHEITYSVILGFVTGSLGAVFKEMLIPALPDYISGKWLAYHVVVCGIMFGIGVFLMKLLAGREQKKAA